MSIEDDTELRDVVLETLDQRGVVGRTKAMLRANIFTALEETAAPHDKIYMLNKRMRENLSTNDGQLMAALITDYFNCWGLEFSKTVFQPETGYDVNSTSRVNLCSSLGLAAPPDQQPVLAELMKRLQDGTSLNQSPGAGEKLSRRQLPGHSAMDEESVIPKDLSSRQIADAKAKFALYDKDGNGTIDKDELRQLFIDMFPNFHRNMLERYVTDEFRAADSDFSAGIEMDEFIDLYRRLFISCRSIVSHDVSDLITPRSPSPRLSNASPRLSKIPIKSEQQGGAMKESIGSPRETHGSKIPQLSPMVSHSESGNSASSTTDTQKSATGQKADLEMKSIDKSLADLGFDIPDEDDESIRTKSDGYEDDFERSNASSAGSHKKSNSIRTGDSISTEDITDKMDDEDIDALLKDNDISWGNETEDRSITDDSSVKGVDYWEMVPKK